MAIFYSYIIGCPKLHIHGDMHTFTYACTHMHIINTHTHNTHAHTHHVYGLIIFQTFLMIKNLITCFWSTEKNGHL